MTAEEELGQLRATVRALKDRQDILDYIVREARGRDRQDVDLIASCYWEDGTDEHGPVVTPAHAYPAAANAGHAAGFSATSHSLTSHSCEIDGDTASCETYVVGGLLARDGASCTIAPGRYVDRLDRRGGEWRITVRRTVVDMCVTGDASWLASRAIAGFLKGAWSKEDVSYQRPIQSDGSGPRW